MHEETIKALFRECEKYKEESTCNKRKIGAALVFPDGVAYFATNVSPTDPCNLKGEDYCTREGDGFIEMPEYETCPSPCAEASTIIQSKVDGRKTKEGALITTDFPCERCTNILIDSGIVSELYYGDYKNDESRPREWVYEIWMAREDIPIYRIINNGVYKHPNILDNIGIFRHAIRTPGYVYLRQMIDNGIKAHAERGKILWKSDNELSMVPLL